MGTTCMFHLGSSAHNKRKGKGAGYPHRRVTLIGDAYEVGVSLAHHLVLPGCGCGYRLGGCGYCLGVGAGNAWVGAGTAWVWVRVTPGWGAGNAWVGCGGLDMYRMHQCTIRDLPTVSVCSVNACRWHVSPSWSTAGQGHSVPTRRARIPYLIIGTLLPRRPRLPHVVLVRQFQRWYVHLRMPPRVHRCFEMLGLLQQAKAADIPVKSMELHAGGKVRAPPSPCRVYCVL